MATNYIALLHMYKVVDSCTTIEQLEMYSRSLNNNPYANSLVEATERELFNKYIVEAGNKLNP